MSARPSQNRIKAAIRIVHLSAIFISLSIVSFTLAELIFVIILLLSEKAMEFDGRAQIGFSVRKNNVRTKVLITVIKTS